MGADVIFKELRFAQSKDDLLRKSTVAVDMYEYIEDDIESETGDGGQLLNGNYDEKTSAASFQQALLAWRKGDEKKKPTGKSRRSTHEAAVDTVRDSNGELNQTGLPNIEFHSSNLTYGEKLLLKKYRRANKNHEDFFNHRTPLSKLPESIDLSNGTIEVEVEQRFSNFFFLYMNIFSLCMMKVLERLLLLLMMMIMKKKNCSNYNKQNVIEDLLHVRIVQR